MFLWIAFAFLTAAVLAAVLAPLARAARQDEPLESMDTGAVAVYRDQLQEIAAAGFKVEPRRVIAETISGNVATAQRRGFTRLLDRLETGDVLVVTKLDRLGRNVMDVGSTVAKLAELEVRVHCLALGGVDLTSSSGKLTMNVLNAVAEFERDLLIERTQAGLSRAKSEGKTLGRPLSLTEDQRRAVERRLAKGLTVSALARSFNTSRPTIMRVRDAMPVP